MTLSETEYQNQIAALRERLELQELISDVSAILIDLPACEVDAQLELGLKRIVEFLGVDRSSFGEFTGDLKQLRATHSYAVPGIEPFPKVIVAEILPWYVGKLVAGEIVKLEHVAELPEAATAERAYAQRVGVKSTLAIPVSIGGEMTCAIALGSFRAYRSWPHELVEQFKRVAEIFGHAIYRKRAEQKLESQYQFERMISALSASFVNLPPGEVDREIRTALQQIREFFKADRCILRETLREKAEAPIIHACHAEGISGAPDTIRYEEECPWLAEKVLSGETVAFHVKDLPPEAAIDRRFAERLGIRSQLAIPLQLGGAIAHILSLSAVRSERTWPEEAIARLRLAGEIFVHALERRRAEEELQNSYREIEQLKDRLQLEADYLRQEIEISHREGDIVGQSEAMQRVLRQVEQVAPSDTSVLIQGETGTGKELIAQAIHNLSPRRHRLMVNVNCASLPVTLIESELFGREKGAYTGAMVRQIGRFELANESTIFFDEIGELPMEVQAKLLRVLQEGEFERLGSPNTIKVNVRVIAASNRDLAEAVQKGLFREDLYYRLNVFPIEVPPLRERQADIPELVWTFAREYGEKMGKKTRNISKSVMEELQRYSWPGNIRELRNVIERAMILSNGSTLSVQIPAQKESKSARFLTMKEMEAKYITEVLEKTNGCIKGERGAAAILGLKPSTLYSRMGKLGISLKRKKVN